jgi:hypothetical protein
MWRAVDAIIRVQKNNYSKGLSRKTQKISTIWDSFSVLEGSEDEKPSNYALSKDF